jgi:acetyl-CoA acetyltransferase
MTCAVIGIGRTAYSRNSGRTTRSMAVSAGRDAIADAGLVPGDVDGICTYMVNDSEQPINVGWALGIDQLDWANAMYGGGNLVADQIATAAAVIEAGLCRAVLVYRSLNGRSGRRFGSIDGPMQVDHDNQFDTVSGFLVPPQWIAMWARRHQHEYGSTCEDLGQIAITQRAHAQSNKHAVRREPLSMDDYLAARWINEPFRPLDCTSEVHGAVAILIAGEDVVRDAAQPPMWLVGSSNSQSGASWTAWDDPTEMFSRTAGPKIWEKTGLAPSDMDVACMYDCFTYTVM